MNKKNFLNIPVLSVLIISLCLPGSPIPTVTTSISSPMAIVSAYSPNHVLVGFYPDAAGSKTAQAALESGAQQGLERQLSMGQLSPLFVGMLPQQSAALNATPKARKLLSLPDQPVAIYSLSLLPGVEVDNALKALRMNPAVAFAEPDYQAIPFSVPNDTRFSEQWGLTKIQAPQAWDTATGSNDTVIAVIDSGIKVDHEDLANQLWTNPYEIPGNGIDDDHNGYIDDIHGANVFTKTGTLTDSTGHGTQVAGVIAAQTNNGVGVAGVCWKCRLMVVKVMGATGTANYSDIAAGVNYAVKMGAKVINLSLGGYSDSATLKAAIQAAAQTAVVIAGAGNDNTSTPFYPAAYTDSVLAVAGTAPDDTKHSASNFGTWVGISAPGENILTTDFGGTYYTPVSGTSLAAPFVSGVAGLLASKNPGWSPDLIRSQMTHTANNVDSVNPTFAGKLGSGRLNAYQAVTTSPVPNFSILDFSANGKLSGTIKADGSSVSLWLSMKNDWLSTPSATATLSSSSADVHISKGSATFTAAASGLTLENSADTFQVSVTAGKYGIDLPFRLAMTAGGVTQNIDFIVQSESQTMNYSGSITTNTHWLNTRTYHVTGNLTIKNTAVLTIDPGTQILIDPGFFIKIEGTFIADGTANEPIIFTTSSPGNAHWTGLTFTDLAAPAVFDDNGIYQGGSILRHVEVSYADTAVTIQTQAPYIANDLFDHNSNGINQSSAGAIHIIDSAFTEIGLNQNNMSTGYAIQLTAGDSFISGNVLSNNGGAISYSAMNNGSNVLTVQDNIFTNNGSVNLNGPAVFTRNLISGASQSALSALYLGNGSASVSFNRITGNGGITLNPNRLDFQHNLIATTACTPTPCTNNPAVSVMINNNQNFISTPGVVYNPDLDAFAVGWMESNLVKIQQMSSSGEIVGPSHTINNDNSITSYSMVYNPQTKEYLVVFATMSTGVWAQRLNSSLQSQGAPIQVAAFGSNLPRVVYQSGENLYLVAWRGTPGGGSDGIYAQYLTAAGALSGGMQAVSSGYSVSSYFADLAYDPVNARSLAVFNENNATCPGCLAGAWLTSGGTPAPFKITDDPGANGQNPAVSFGSGANVYGLAWGSYFNNNQYVYGVNVSAASGTPFDLPLAYKLNPFSTQSMLTPSIAYGAGGNKFLSIWNSAANTNYAVDSTVEGRLINPDSTLSGSIFPIGVGTSYQSTALAYGSGSGGRYLAVWPLYRSNAWSLNGQLLDETGTKVGGVIGVSNPYLIANNTVIGNPGGGLQIGGSQAGALIIRDNNLIGNGAAGTYDIKLNSDTGRQTITTTNNYWGPIQAGEIGGRIFDCNDDANTSCGANNATLGEVIYDPLLSSPSQGAPAFVYTSTFDPQPVGLNQNGTISLNFSRPMDTSKMPDLTFYDSRRGMLEDLTQANRATLIAKDPASGSIWFGCGSMSGTNCKGIIRFDGKNWTTFAPPSTPATEKVNALFVTRNGDVWVASYNDQSAIYRLSGGVWTAFKFSEISGGKWWSNSVYYISEDSLGIVWFSTTIPGPGLLSYNGVTWKIYNQSDNSLLASSINSMAPDGQGKIWFIFMAPPPSTTYTLASFDGVTWKTYTAGDGLPANTGFVNNLYGDHQGRVWFTYQIGAGATTVYLGLIENGAIRSFNTTDVFGSTTWSFGFADHPDGTVWISSGQNMAVGTAKVAIYDGKKFTTQSSPITFPFVIDSNGSAFMPGYGSTTNARVLWGGPDYSFDTGKWLSATNYQASYYFTARIPAGTYRIAANGSFGTDDVEAYSGGIPAFNVDYAGQVSESTPPNSPKVKAGGKAGDPGYFIALWTIVDPKSQVDSYRYAIGTTPGATNILYWTTLSQAQIERTGLALNQGQTYWVSVQAHNLIGLWGTSGYASFVAGQPMKMNFYLPSIIRK